MKAISIGAALAALREEFGDDVKVSKLRHLEAEGLVKPDRSPGGYRQYSEHDMDRLRYILRAQRENYLPLKVIGEHLDAMDRGLEPPKPAGAPSVPIKGDAHAAAELLRAHGSDARVSRKELIKTAEIDEELLDDLAEFGLVRTRTGGRHYDAESVNIARLAGELSKSWGLQPRHLKMIMNSVERELGLVEQITEPIRRSREAGAEGRADQAAQEISTLALQLHAALMRLGLRSQR